MRRYVRTLKEQVARGQCRYYEPVVDAVPGIQCQADPGELRGALIAGVERTLYFVVFVLACSRLMYVGARLRPLDTDAFIQLHDEAFRYYGDTLCHLLKATSPRIDKDPLVGFRDLLLQHGPVNTELQMVLTQQALRCSITVRLGNRPR